MVVGVYRVVLILPGNNSLKGKRAVVRRILDRARSRFNVAAAEVDELDNKRRAALGFVVISNDTRHTNSMLDNIASFVLRITDAVIVDDKIELMHVSDELGRGMGEAEINNKFSE